MRAPLEPIWIAEPSGVELLLDRIGRADRIAIDTEFHGERSYLPHLMLLQIGFDDAIYLVDPLAGVDVRAIFAAIRDSGAIVIGHALHNDLEIVALGHEIVFSRLFDTQIAAAFLGFGLQIGLANLLRLELKVRLGKGSQMADWSRRPLPERQLAYAADDVRFLLELHDRLGGRLDEMGRLGWVLEECAPLGVRERYGRDPMQCWQRVSGARKLRPKEAGVLVELAAERERIAAELNQVPHFLLSDEALIALARIAPASLADMDGNRRLNHRNIQRFADRWLAAVARGVRKPLETPPGRPPPPPGVEAVAGLVMLLVAELSAREGVAAQLLLRRKNVIEALQQGCTSREELLDRLELHGWRAELLGEPVWSLLDGSTRARVRCGSPEELGVDFVDKNPA
ncbi:MAG: Ribonuclease [Pseudomonadota bacterium]|jgi:ribonuclease D